MNKQDENKTRELYYYHCNEKYCGGFNDCKNCPKSKADESLLKMAAWKEQQMIDRAKEFISTWFYKHPHASWLICSDEFQDLDDCLERLEKEMKEEN